MGLNDFQTLTDVLLANRQRDQRIDYVQGEQTERSVSFAELHERALGILFHLQRLGLRPGDRLILNLLDNEQFIDAYWAALAGGIVPVPVAVGISDEHRHKLFRIARRLGRPYLYTEQKLAERLQRFAAAEGLESEHAALAERTFVVEQLDDISRAGRRHEARSDDVCFIQFSSGSTSDPKGIVLTHRNILANARGASEAARFTERDVTLSWMPLTHDMGLIGFHLMMFANGMHQTLMPTDLFIRRPALWLQLAARKGVTLLCSPNFGYKHFLKVFDAAKFGDVDLSRVRLLFNGAEPISVPLCEEFLAAMARYGLNREAMFPVYGLAEATLAVSFPRLRSELRSTRVDRTSLGVGDRVRRKEAGERDALELVSVGRAIPYCELRIGADDGSALPEDTVGHILIRGDNVTGGYFEAPDINRDAFTADGYLRTGDLGFVHDGELHITGRSKEIIFVNGQNYYPHDLEGIAQHAEGMELGKIAIAGQPSESARGDELLAFVLYRGDPAGFLPLAATISRLINEHAGVEVAQVVPVKRIPKTTSGKIQRGHLLRAYADGEFDEALAELAALRQRSPAAATTQLSDIEQRLKQICEAALPDKRIDVHDNLFEVGTSSLVLIQIHEQIDESWPGAVDIVELFDYPTIAELAAHLEQKLPAAG